ncbi:MAG: hypothetical protein L3K09_04245 [Thermoplasmata archaeon]|nr:hypothetical protein [Thermoplasmata archaeon]
MGRSLPLAVLGSGGWKAFFQSIVGRAVLIVIGIVTVALSFLFVGAIVAILAMLIFGLAVPIYLGIKSLKQLAIMGIVIILLAPIMAGPIFAYTARQTSPAAASSSDLPYGNNGSILQNAVVRPFTGPAGGVYVYSMSLNPQFLPANSSGVLWVEIFISTCPDATSNTSAYCASGYPFYNYTRSFGVNGTFTDQQVTFNVTLPGSQIWWWQAAAVFNVSGKITWAFLVSDSGYTDEQGPVSGDFLSTTAIATESIFTVVPIYVGFVYFFALLVYGYFKNRERRRSAPSMGLPPSGAPPSTAPFPGGSAGTVAPGGSPAPGELTCPNCKAVVYPNEASCWKCGASLTGSKGSSTPLPSK